MFDSILLSIIMKMIQNCGAYQLLLASSCCTRGVANVVVVTRNGNGIVGMQKTTRSSQKMPAGRMPRSTARGAARASAAGAATQRITVLKIVD